MDDPSTPRPPRRQLPAFDPVPLRARRDGWTEARQREFIRLLHVKRSISTACRAVGMSRKSAYALRERPGAESFAAAWDAAFHGNAQVVPAEHYPLWQALLRGRTRGIVRKGKVIGTITRPDNDAALRLLKRLDRSGRPPRAWQRSRGPEPEGDK
ncbi:MAG TPA: hypothetical protein VEC11_08130 [Allosphingosinicella sp.]|nr:hypothetical protein [Allosphingosinicella sp.]